MTQESSKYVKKATITNAEFIGQLVEMFLGIALCVAGAVIGFTSEAGFQGAAIVMLIVGAYLVIGGLSGIIPYGIGVLFEKGKYIAFNETTLVIHSPNAKKCVSVPLAKIKAVKKEKGFSLDIMGSLVLKLKGCGCVRVQYENEKGKRDEVVFGPIDGFKIFHKELSDRIGK